MRFQLQGRRGWSKRLSLRSGSTSQAKLHFHIWLFSLRNSSVRHSSEEGGFREANWSLSSLLRPWEAKGLAPRITVSQPPPLEYTKELSVSQTDGVKNDAWPLCLMLHMLGWFYKFNKQFCPLCEKPGEPFIIMWRCPWPFQATIVGAKELHKNSL